MLRWGVAHPALPLNPPDGHSATAKGTGGLFSGGGRALTGISKALAPFSLSDSANSYELDPIHIPKEN